MMMSTEECCYLEKQVLLSQDNKIIHFRDKLTCYHEKTTFDVLR